MKPASNDLNDLISAAEAELAREPTREATQAAGGAGPARQGVEAARVPRGKLPDTLPNAALAGLVAYTPVGNNYQLFSASGGISVTLEPDGRKTVRQGPP